jgi:MFS family permease
MATKLDLTADQCLDEAECMSTFTLTNPIVVTPVAVPRPRLFTLPMVLLLLVDFAAMSSFYLLLSVVPLYSTANGLGSVGAGLATGVLMFAAVAAEIATQPLAARWGHRRLLMVGLVLLGAPALAVPMISSVWTLMGVSVLRGFGFAMIVVAVGALTASTVPAERRGEGMGVLGVVAMLPAVVALPIGVWLVGRLGFTTVFGIAAAASLFAVVLVVKLPEAGPASDSHGLRGMRGTATLLPIIVFAATAVAGGVVVAFLPSAVPAGVAVVALFVQAAAATATRWLAGRYCDRHGAAALLPPAVVVTALGMGVAAATGSSLAVVAGMTVFGIGFGLAQAASLNTMLERVPVSEYGAVSAAWNAAYDLGWGLGALGIGVVVAMLGYSAAFAVAGVLVIAALPVALKARN